MIIETMDDVSRGIEHICSVDPAMKHAFSWSGMPDLRRTASGFAALLEIVVGQQVSVASANAVMVRVRTVFAPLTAEFVATASDNHFRAAGLSAPKIKTFKAVSLAIIEGQLDLDILASIPVHDAHAALCAIKGIGPWTAGIYLMFALGHADAFAAGDLALQEAARHIYALPGRPDANALLVLADSWSPWRAVGARMLWQSYHVIKGRSGLVSNG